MQLNMNGEKPIFLQFAEELEDNILKGIFEEETQIPSTTEVAIKFKINPATANRGVTHTPDSGSASPATSGARRVASHSAFAANRARNTKSPSAMRGLRGSCDAASNFRVSNCFSTSMQREKCAMSLRRM